MPAARDGETIRVMCDDCNKEFEVTLEPKMKGRPLTDDDEQHEIVACPFCESTNVGEV